MLLTFYLLIWYNRLCLSYICYLCYTYIDVMLHTCCLCILNSSHFVCNMLLLIYSCVLLTCHLSAYCCCYYKYCLLVAFTFIDCTAFKILLLQVMANVRVSSNSKMRSVGMHINVIPLQAQEGLTWWQPLSPPGGLDMHLFMGKCHLLEKHGSAWHVALLWVNVISL